MASMRTCAAAARIDALLPLPLAPTPLPGGRPRFLPMPGVDIGLGGRGSRGAFGCFAGLGGLGGRSATGAAGRHLDTVDFADGMIQAGSGRGAPGTPGFECYACLEARSIDCTAAAMCSDKQVQNTSIWCFVSYFPAPSRTCMLSAGTLALKASLSLPVVTLFECLESRLGFHACTLMSMPDLWPARRRECTGSRT